jgi:hypothetical protein
MASENNSGTIFMLIGGAALVYWFMSQQSNETIGPDLQQPNKGPAPAPPASSYPSNSPAANPPAAAVDPSSGKVPQQGNYASDPVVPIPALLVRAAGTGSQNVDEWNYWYQQILGGAQQPDPLTFLPEGFDRTQNISATDYVRYRGLGRVTGNRYQAQASRIIRQSSF